MLTLYTVANLPRQTEGKEFCVIDTYQEFQEVSHRAGLLVNIIQCLHVSPPPRSAVHRQ